MLMVVAHLNDFAMGFIMRDGLMCIYEVHSM